MIVLSACRDALCFLRHIVHPTQFQMLSCYINEFILLTLYNVSSLLFTFGFMLRRAFPFPTWLCACAFPNYLMASTTHLNLPIFRVDPRCAYAFYICSESRGEGARCDSCSIDLAIYNDRRDDLQQCTEAELTNHSEIIMLGRSPNQISQQPPAPLAPQDICQLVAAALQCEIFRDLCKCNLALNFFFFWPEPTTHLKFARFEFIRLSNL